MWKVDNRFLRRHTTGLTWSKFFQLRAPALTCFDILFDLAYWRRLCVGLIELREEIWFNLQPLPTLAHEPLALTSRLYQTDIYFLKVNNGNTRTMWEKCSKIKIKTSKQHYWSEVSIFDFEQVNTSRYNVLDRRFI